MVLGRLVDGEELHHPFPLALVHGAGLWQRQDHSTQQVRKDLDLMPQQNMGSVGIHNTINLD